MAGIILSSCAYSTSLHKKRGFALARLARIVVFFLSPLLFSPVAFSYESVPVVDRQVLTQWGITWEFDRPYRTGQFANGDWWVVGPVTVTEIDTQSSNVHLAGSMINLIPNKPQGLYEGVGIVPYDSNLNAAIGLPRAIAAGSSLLSAMATPVLVQHSTKFREIAILTVLAVEPAAGSFRPPYAGTNKTIKPQWNVSNLDYNALRNHPMPVPTNAPSLQLMEQATQRPLLEITNTHVNSEFKASWAGVFPQRDYGEHVSHISGGAGLLLNTNLSNAAKEKLLINMVQWGIDVYGLQWGTDTNGKTLRHSFPVEGGKHHGRLLPAFIAGKVLDLDILQGIRDFDQFPEIHALAFITQADINIAKAGTAKPYTQDQLGMPEFMPVGRHSEYTSNDWHYTGYRFTTGSPNAASIATILLMGGA